MNDTSKNSPLAVFNLLALIITGISVSWWILYFTDAFPVFGGLLGLGGLFTWIAFVGNILTSERKKELQQLFDRKVLQQHGLSILLCIVLLGWWFGFAASRATLMVDSLEAASGHVLEVREFQQDSPLSPEPVQRVKLSPRSVVKVLLAAPWFGEKDYFIKVSGFPGRKITVTSYRREPLFVPKMLQERPVVLIRPAARDSGIVLEGFSLEIYIDDEQEPAHFIDEYRGQAVWFGTDSDVEVPERHVAGWRHEFKGAKMNEEGINRWLPPVAIGPVADLSGASTITAHLKNSGGEIKYSGKIIIQSSSRARHFPEEIILHEN